MVKGYFRPSELGFIVSDLLVENFPDVLNVDFTAKMENDLDRVESSEIGCIKRSCPGFTKPLKRAWNQPPKIC